MALAGQEMEKRLATTVGGLRRGLADARSLHASLRAEAKELESFVPVLIQGAVSGIHDALRQQVSLTPPLHKHCNDARRQAAWTRRARLRSTAARFTRTSSVHRFCSPSQVAHSPARVAAKQLRLMLRQVPILRERP